MKYNSTLVVGNNKTGKTRNILFNEVEKNLKLKENLVILDSKKEYYNHFYNLLKENNYVINVVNFDNPLKSDGWNPLSYIYYLYNENSDRAIEMLEKMAKNIFYEENSNNDPFWCDMASQLFIGLSLIILRLSKKINGSRMIAFSTIMSLLTLGEKKYKDENISYLRKYVESLNPIDPVYVTLSSICFAPTETKGSIMAVFKVKMNQYIMRENLVKSFLGGSFSEAKVNNTNRNYCVFIIGNHSLDKLTNIVLEQSFYEAFNTNNHTTLIIDGYEKLPTLHNISDMIDKSNNSNISLYITSTNKDKEKNIDNIERIIETKEVFEIEEENDIDLPDLNPIISYEDNFMDILKDGFEKLINNK